MHGGPLRVNRVNFSQYVSLDNKDAQQFDELWAMIGEERSALFYIKGPTYLNMIRPYLTEYVNDYMILQFSNS